MTSTLRRWLADRPQSDLEGIVDRRPDVLEPYPPGDLGELAERLHYPQSLRAVLFDMPQPGIELLETLLVFGSGGITRPALAAIMDRDDGDRELDGVLRLCEMWAIAWEIDGKVWIPGALRALMPAPLRLGPPVAELLSARTVDDLRSRALALGCSVRNRKTEILATIEDWYTDGDAIRAIAASAPADQRELLEVAAWTNPVLRAEAAFIFPGRVDPAISWLLNHGLIIADWQRVVVPREVGVAIRGFAWHPPLTAVEPRVPTVAVGVEVVDRDAAAAANIAIEQFSAVVEACGATPVALLKTGGVGVREIRRLAKATTIPESMARLWLELAYSGDLIDVDGDEIVPTPTFDDWLALPPAGRLASLVELWTDLRAVPLMDARPEGIVAAAALTPDAYGSTAAELRLSVLAIAADQPEGTAVEGGSTTEALQTAAAWRRPVIVRLLTDASFAVRAIWLEASALGLLGRDAASSLGRALLAGSEDAFRQVAAGYAQDATGQAIFQADLTVVVPGTPTAALAHLLDSVADRESRGAAGTWRYKPETIRRALDTGHSAARLVDELRAVSLGGVLPQPLEYLIADVARRHGTLRVRAAGCVLHADDPALIAEIVATKSLGALRLSTVAPTVLVSTLPVDRTLAALRSAGFAPVGEESDGTVMIERRAPRRAPKRASVLPFTTTDLVDDRNDYAIVRQLRGQPDDLDGSAEPDADMALRARVQRHLHAVPPDHVEAPAAPTGLASARTSTLRVVQRSAVHLTPDEQHILAQAIDHEQEIRIEYISANGNVTSRIIQPMELNGGLLVAWCHLRDDERAFSLGGITSVQPA